MEKIIKIYASDYEILKARTEQEARPAADIIHDLLVGKKRGGQTSPLTQVIIDTWHNYWQIEHGAKYQFNIKDTTAAKKLGKSCSEVLGVDDPLVIRKFFGTLLLSIKGGFYYGKELSTFAGGFNTILAGARNYRKTTSGSW